MNKWDANNLGKFSSGFQATSDDPDGISSARNTGGKWAPILIVTSYLWGEVTPFPAIGKVAWLALFYQTVVIAFASYLAWFWLLRQYLASRLSVFSFLTPLFGVAFGVVLMHDAVGMRFAVAAVLVLAGIVLVNRRA